MSVLHTWRTCLSNSIIVVFVANVIYVCMLVGEMTVNDDAVLSLSFSCPPLFFLLCPCILIVCMCIERKRGIAQVESNEQAKEK